MAITSAVSPSPETSPASHASLGRSGRPSARPCGPRIRSPISPHTTTISVTMKNRWSAQYGTPLTTSSRSQTRTWRLSGLRAIASAMMAITSPARSRERRLVDSKDSPRISGFLAPVL